jgi:hypothetical protein
VAVEERTMRVFTDGFAGELVVPGDEGYDAAVLGLNQSFAVS